MAEAAKFLRRDGTPTSHPPYGPPKWSVDESRRSVADWRSRPRSADAHRIAVSEFVLSGSAAVLVDQAAEDVDPFHSRRCGGRSNCGQSTGRSGWLQVEGTVRPSGVVMPQVFGQDSVHLPLVADQVRSDQG